MNQSNVWQPQEKVRLITNVRGQHRGGRQQADPTTEKASRQTVCPPTSLDEHIAQRRFAKAAATPVPAVGYVVSNQPYIPAAIGYVASNQSVMRCISATKPS